MFAPHCPRCKSVRIQLGFQDAPLLRRLIGIRELLCNNCNLEFRGFLLFHKLERVHSTHSETIANKRRAPRFKAQIPVNVAVMLESPVSSQNQYSAVIRGHTRDISKIGLAIVLPAIRSGEHSFVDSNKGLWVSLQLPSGLVTMQVTPVRYERLGPASGYLIGAHIRKIDKGGRSRFSSYVDDLK
jgi:hypothetical protein